MINIAKILKAYPKGTKLYSPVFGECTLKYVDCKDEAIYIALDGDSYFFSPFGQYVTDINDPKGECLLFPSKDNRDWSTFKKDRPLKPKFKPFDKVVVRNTGNIWYASMFSHYKPGVELIYVTIGQGHFNECLPYNEETAKLIGTNEVYLESV